jgi:hypothetical protein
MKRSERLMRNTILALLGASVLYVAVNRLYAARTPASPAQRAPDAVGRASLDTREFDHSGRITPFVTE